MRKTIDGTIDEGSAQEQFDKAAAKDKYTEGGDVKLGNYTWKTLNFTWNKQPSVVLYADITEGLYAEVTLYETTLEDAAVNAFLEASNLQRTTTLPIRLAWTRLSKSSLRTIT
mgnify:CR=1 FL=1